LLAGFCKAVGLKNKSQNNSRNQEFQIRHRALGLAMCVSGDQGVILKVIKWEICGSIGVRICKAVGSLELILGFSKKKIPAASAIETALAFQCLCKTRRQRCHSTRIFMQNMEI
jgi:hypothetical protein